MNQNPFDIESPPEREIDILRRVVIALQDRLPPSWRSLLTEEVAIGGGRVDGVLDISSPTGERTSILIEAKRVLEARDIAQTVRQLRSYAEMADLADLAPSPFIAARYLNPRVRERLAEQQIGYGDATGNLYLALERPALFVRDRGSQKDPWRGPGRPRGSLRGPAAGRMVRAAVDYAPPFSVPELIRRAEVSTGAGYRVVDLLEREDLIEREPRGPLTAVDWKRLLDRWGRDYDFGAKGTSLQLLQPRGLERFLQDLSNAEVPRYAVTGSVAAERFSEYAPAKLAMIYADDPTGVAEELGLRPVDSGANVLMVGPADDFVFARSRTIDGIEVAAPSQVVVDLLSRGGRSVTEASELMDWMELNEPAWRR